MLVSWIWAAIFHVPLDLIKWGMAYALNEDGFRDRMHGKKPTNVATETAEVDLPPQVRLASSWLGACLQREVLLASAAHRWSAHATSHAAMALVLQVRTLSHQAPWVTCLSRSAERAGQAQQDASAATTQQHCAQRKADRCQIMPAPVAAADLLCMLQSVLVKNSKTPAPPPRSSIARTSAQREAEKSQNVISGGPVTWTNPLGRHSMSQATPQQVCPCSVRVKHKLCSTPYECVPCQHSLPQCCTGAARHCDRAAALTCCQRRKQSTCTALTASFCPPLRLTDTHPVRAVGARLGDEHQPAHRRDRPHIDHGRQVRGGLVPASRGLDTAEMRDSQKAGGGAPCLAQSPIGWPERPAIMYMCASGVAPFEFSGAWGCARACVRVCVSESALKPGLAAPRAVRLLPVHALLRGRHPCRCPVQSRRHCPVDDRPTSRGQRLSCELHECIAPCAARMHSQLASRCTSATKGG